MKMGIKGLVLGLGLFFSLGSAFADSEFDVETDAAVPVAVNDLLSGYRPIQNVLVNDNLAKAQEASKALQTLAARWLSENPSHSLATEVTNINTGSGKIAAAEDLDEARIAFLQVSRSTIAVIRADKALKEKWQLFFCPMVAGKQGFWVQPKGEELANPYMGQAMPGCGTTKPW